MVEAYERAEVIIARQANDPRLRAAFFAAGREYQLRLAPNPRLARWTNGSPWQQYAGVIEGNGRSWVRLAIAGEAMRGVIFDGAELLGVEPADDGTLSVFKLRDLQLPAPLSFADDTLRAPPRAQEAGPTAPGVSLLVAESKLEISAVGDAAFRGRYADAAAARDALLTRMNIVDGIFSAQVGTAIEVTSINLDDGVSGSLDDSTDPPILLDSLGRLRQETAALNSRGLTHLFTGRDLDGNSVGIGYEGTLCRARYSVSLAQAHGSAALDGLISAHEIGHVFGAPHDGEGECASTPQNQFIMSPLLNSQATTFSQCSLEQMRPVVAAAACLEPLAPPDMALPASLGSHDAVAGSDFDWRFAVTNQGDRAAADARITVEFTPTIELVSASLQGGSCVRQAGLATCDLASLAAGQGAELRLVVRSAATGTFSAHAQVVTADDASRSNDEADGTLRVLAAGSAPPSGTATPPSPGGGGGGALDGALAMILGVLLGAAARRRLIPRATTR